VIASAPLGKLQSANRSLEELENQEGDPFLSSINEVDDKQPIIELSTCKFIPK